MIIYFRQDPRFKHFINAGIWQIILDPSTLQIILDPGLLDYPSNMDLNRWYKVLERILDSDIDAGTLQIILDPGIL